MKVAADSLEVSEATAVSHLEVTTLSHPHSAPLPPKRAFCIAPVMSALHCVNVELFQSGCPLQRNVSIFCIQEFV